MIPTTSRTVSQAPTPRKESHHVTHHVTQTYKQNLTLADLNRNDGQPKALIPWEELAYYMSSWPKPEDAQALIHFLGAIATFERKIPTFQRIIRPLLQLIRQQNYDWTSEHEIAFQQLRKALNRLRETQAAVLLRRKTGNRRH